MSVPTDAVVVGNIITQAYRMAGVLTAAGTGINPSEKAEGLQTLNFMIDGLKIERLLFIYTKRTVVDIVTGQKEYSVGPGQDFDIERIEKMQMAGYLVNDGQTEAELPMQVVLTFEQYQAIICKNITSSYPLVFYYQSLVEPVNPGDVPYGKAILWPVPNQTGHIAIYSPITLELVDDFDQIIYTPRGYKELLAYNLAIRIHSLYPRAAWDGDMVTRLAQSYKERVKNMQLVPILQGSDAGALGPGNYPRGYYDARTWNPYTG